MKIITPQPVTDSSLISANIAENDYPTYSSSYTYAMGDRVVVIATHKIYESLQDNNINNDPTNADSVYWVVYNSTNLWRLFDNSISSTCTYTTSIDIKVHTQGYVDSFALLNVNAISCRVIIKDTTETTTLYDSTSNLTTGATITDWHAYFFTAPQNNDDFILTGLPTSYNAVYRIIISGSTIEIGEMLIGKLADIGGTQYGASLGITDYSVKTRDQFGGYYLQERAFSKRNTFQVEIYNTQLDLTMQLLSSLRAFPALYYSTDNYQSTWVYGFYKDFSVTIQYPEVSMCNLELEGLT